MSEPSNYFVIGKGYLKPADTEDEAYELADEHGGVVYALAHKTYCAYCGHVVEVRDRDEALSLIAEHIANCGDHPLGKVVQENMRLEQALAAQRKENEPCVWTYQDHFGYYETSCDADWQFVDGGMKDNGVHYCMNCGRPAREVGGEEQGDG